MIKSDSESSISNPTFKVLHYETSVYQCFIELKKDSLTSNGYLDLVKVPGLYVIGAGSYLKSMRTKNKLSQRTIAKALGVSSMQISQWERNITKIPLNYLIKFAKNLDINKETIYSFIESGQFDIKHKLPVKLERISNIVKYLYPVKTNYKKSINLLKCSDEAIKELQSALNVKIFYHSKGKNKNLGQIHSSGLYNFLKVFFRYYEMVKIRPPLTSEVRAWHENDIDLKHAVICPLLQTDGWSTTRESFKTSPAIKYHGNDEILHKFLVDAFFFEYNLLPTTYFHKGADGCHLTEYKQKNVINIIADILSICGSTKTSPARGQSIETYLQESQPHLKYLKTSSNIIQMIVLRIWASAEGCAGIQRTNGYFKPSLTISCAHPVLARQLIQIAAQHNINFTKTTSKLTWSGVNKIANTSLRGCLEFLKLGNFVEGVKISAKSKYHHGLDKDNLLLGIFKFKKREKTNQKLRSLSLKDVHSRINNIIESGEYNSKEYYINLFS